jgi:hypothetical protein
MSAAPPIPNAQPAQATPVTLLELVQALADVTEDDREVVATVLQMLSTGRVRLCGNFRNTPPDDLR